MAILAIYTGNGVTKQMYEDLRKEVDWEHKQPPGGIFHAAGFDDSGNNIRVADVWESEQQLNDFVSSRLKPAMEKFNVPMPGVEVFSIHNINAFPEIDKHRVK
jgi:hypothetical protein